MDFFFLYCEGRQFSLLENFSALIIFEISEVTISLGGRESAVSSTWKDTDDPWPRETPGRKETA